MTHLPEESLHDLAVHGDEAAFEALIGPLVEPGLRLAYSMLGDRSEAEDVTQEAITRAWRNLSRLRAETAVRAWFLAIVANQARNARRGRWFQTIRLAEPEPRIEVEPQPERVDVSRALARLPSSDRHALFLYYYLDLPIAEVATVLGTSDTAARVRIHRAVARVRADLTGDEA